MIGKTRLSLNLEKILKTTGKREAGMQNKSQKQLSILLLLLVLFAVSSRGVLLRPSITAKKDLSNESKPNFEAKIEAYKVIESDKVFNREE